VTQCPTGAVTPAKKDFATLEMDEEQYVGTPERDGADVEEITCQRAGALGFQQL
jgi:hypothetical protein